MLFIVQALTVCGCLLELFSRHFTARCIFLLLHSLLQPSCCPLPADFDCLQHFFFVSCLIHGSIRGCPSIYLHACENRKPSAQTKHGILTLIYGLLCMRRTRVMLATTGRWELSAGMKCRMDLMIQGICWMAMETQKTGKRRAACQHECTHYYYCWLSLHLFPVQL
jgi:hypothetical protein